MDPLPLLALLDLSGFAEGVLEHHTYLGAILILVSCGFGMPIPEEVTIVGSGILLHKGVVDYWGIMAACWFGVIAGDVVPFTVGRVWGVRAFEHRWVRRIVNPRRLERLEARFQRHLTWGVFTCRFFPGLRWPGYFIAGHLRMPVWKWLLLDGIGAAIMVPFALHLGVLFGENADLLAQKVKDFHLVLAFGAFALLATVVVRSRMARARAREESEVGVEVPQAPSPVQGAPTNPRAADAPSDPRV